MVIHIKHNIKNYADVPGRRSALLSPRPPPRATHLVTSPRCPEHALQVGRRIEEGAVQGIRRALPALEDTHLAVPR